MAVVWNYLYDVRKTVLSFKALRSVEMQERLTTCNFC